MAQTTQKDSIVLMDDELYNMMWLVDYLSNKGYSVLPARTANEALQMLREEIYRCAIIDLNIPFFEPLNEAIKSLKDVYRRYPGLFVAREARNCGYRDRQVVIYSVHRDVEVYEESDKLGCTYILKGRPTEMKAELNNILAFDPTTSPSVKLTPTK